MTDNSTRLSTVNCCKAPDPAPVRQIATRSPGCTCWLTNLRSALRTFAMLSKERPRSSTISTMVRRTSSGRICASRAGGKAGTALGKGLGPASLCAGAALCSGATSDIRKVRQRLQLAVLEDLEISGRQVGDLVPFGIGHHGVHLHQRRSDGENSLWPLGVRRRCSRLLPGSEQRANHEDAGDCLHTFILTDGSPRAAAGSRTPARCRRLAQAKPVRLRTEAGVSDFSCSCEGNRRG
jgi:hypothetical protein